MAATVTETTTLKRVLRLIDEVENAIPANNLAARTSVEILLTRLTANMSRELRTAIHGRGSSATPTKPR